MRAARLMALASLGVLAIGVAAAPVASAAPASSAPQVPYQDGRSAGAITLYDASGNVVTSGSIDAIPLVARATSTQPVPAAYASNDPAASLFVMVPRPDVDPSEWVGLPYTAADHYGPSTQPEVRLVPDDSSLASFMDIRPPVWNGFLQLRLVLGASGQEPDLISYATADIQVTGSTWQLIQSGPTAQDLRAASAMGLPTKGIAQGKSYAAASSGGSSPASGSASGAAAGTSVVPQSAAAGPGTSSSAAATAAPGTGSPRSLGDVALARQAQGHRSVSGTGAIAAFLLAAVALLWWRQSRVSGSPHRARSRLLDDDVRSKA